MSENKGSIQTDKEGLGETMSFFMKTSKTEPEMGKKVIARSRNVASSLLRMAFSTYG
jgi:uncharacterized protein YpmS